MVEVATGKVTQRKLWTIRGSQPAAEMLKSVPGTKTYRRGEYVSRVVKAWVA